ncbi:hypothetical protein ACTXPA_03245 [Glutamicibacter arilaitensis]|uniref:hypothetical protein n=1 Tax=Glutamicibacter arilaitensis TaxID=256701 RepID=UPI003FD491A0
MSEEKPGFSVSKLGTYTDAYLSDQAVLFARRAETLGGLCRFYSEQKTEANDALRSADNMMEALQTMQRWEGMYEAANSMFEDVLKKQRSCEVEMDFRKVSR